MQREDNSINNRSWFKMASGDPWRRSGRVSPSAMATRSERHVYALTKSNQSPIYLCYKLYALMLRSNSFRNLFLKPKTSNPL